MNVLKPCCGAAVDIGLLLVRLPIGVIFLMAGINKFRGGVGEFVTKAAGAVPAFMPPGLGKAYLHGVPYAEVIVGAALILGILTRVFGLIASLMLVSFMIAVTGLKGKEGAPFHPNVMYLSITLLLMLASGGRFSVDGLILRARAKPQAAVE